MNTNHDVEHRAQEYSVASCQAGIHSGNISIMKSSHERGFSIVIIPLVISLVLLVGAAVFGGWAYSHMLDYKNNVDSKVTAAVATATQQESAAKDAEYAEKDKQPLKPYTGPAAYGSVTINYPKTWSAYVADDTNSSPYIDGYFYPNVVPDIQSENSVYALRVQVVQEPYNTVLNDVSSFVTQGTAHVTPFTAPKVKGIIGARIDGKIDNTRSGIMVVLPLRNMTLKIWTEAPEFEKDFNNNILPNFTFAP